MRALCLGCRTAELHNAEPAVAEADPERLHATVAAESCLLVLLAVEDHDVASVVPSARAVRRAIRKAGYSTVLVNLFAHLSDNLAPPHDSALFGEELVARLRETLPGVRIERSDFGFRKQMTLNIMEGINDQRFISA